MPSAVELTCAGAWKESGGRAAAALIFSVFCEGLLAVNRIARRINEQRETPRFDGGG